MDKLCKMTRIFSHCSAVIFIHVNVVGYIHEILVLHGYTNAWERTAHGMTPEMRLVQHYCLHTLLGFMPHAALTTESMYSVNCFLLVLMPSTPSLSAGFWLYSLCGTTIAPLPTADTGTKRPSPCASNGHGKTQPQHSTGHDPRLPGNADPSHWSKEGYSPGQDVSWIPSICCMFFVFSPCYFVALLLWFEWYLKDNEVSATLICWLSDMPHEHQSGWGWYRTLLVICK